MHEHLGLVLSGSSGVPPTPPTNQNAASSGASQPAGPPAVRSHPPAAASSSAAGPSTNNNTRGHQSSVQQPQPQVPQQQLRQQQAIHQPAQQQAAQGQLPAALQNQQPPAATPADEIAALRVRITELERGVAQGNQLPARATIPHQDLIADPAEVERVCASLASVKEESKKVTLPELRPGHKVSTLSLPIPPKVEEAFKSYHYVPYMALTHTARSKAYLRGEELSFVFTQDGLMAKGLNRSNEILISTVDWIAASKAAEERTLHHWGVDRESALVSHHLVVLNIGQTYGCNAS
ncbi:hypothetical protein EDB19DRAFT_1834063 [Suillus lakei]|nr:hypothetical protein EDB19DRAFT_1834063 [Suillus lakei]